MKAMAVNLKIINAGIPNEIRDDIIGFASFMPKKIFPKTVVKQSNKPKSTKKEVKK